MNGERGSREAPSLFFMPHPAEQMQSQTNYIYYRYPYKSIHHIHNTPCDR